MESHKTKVKHKLQEQNVNSYKFDITKPSSSFIKQANHSKHLESYN